MFDVRDYTVICNSLETHKTNRKMAQLSELEVFRKTVYAEARGESVEGQKWVAWVIKNRARLNRQYWGGSKIKDVCLHPRQFECWNGVNDISIHEPEVYRQVCEVVDAIYHADPNDDPTNGTDHYHNPDKEGIPSWVHNCVFVKKIGNHTFYKSKS
ncbi:unnamed protein product [Adineta ricciae]|uniref:Cell wall hydrolase SleB domain-containing protein n=2 Tax=Adineta ricciae TaxID=249248 RepID=A0A813ML75_ADIRI|nr:unnamed protein product [Adineta ricciae]